MAQSVERILGKDEVGGSIPPMGTKLEIFILDVRFCMTVYHFFGGITHGKGKVSKNQTT